jgi:ribosomal protein L32
MPDKETLLPGLYCPCCGQNGYTVEVPELLNMPALKTEMAFPHRRCRNCGFKWYEAKDVIALVVTYKYEVSDRGLGRSTPEV